MLKSLEEVGEAMFLAEQGNQELARMIVNSVRRLFGRMNDAAVDAITPALSTQK